MSKKIEKTADIENINNNSINAKKTFNKKKRKKVLKTVIFTLVILAVAVLFVFKSGLANKIFSKENSSANTLSTYTVSTRTITKVLTSTGTIEPYDKRDISALVNGEIVFDYIDEGDTVTKDQLIYEIDSESLDSSVSRAKNQLKNSNTALNKALENREKLNVTSDYSGIIQKMHVEVGDEVNAGQLIAEIIDNNIMCIDVPFIVNDCENISVGDVAVLEVEAFSYDKVEGVVTEISATTNPHSVPTTKNVTISVKNPGSITVGTVAYAQINSVACADSGTFYYNDEGSVFAKIAGEVTELCFDEGDVVSKNNIIVRLASTDLEDQIENLQNNVDDAQSYLDDALNSYDNYNIQAPISGKVVTKNYKSGDKITSGQGMSNTLATIYDMSALVFNMSIDEIDIDSLSVGQDVIVTCDSREGIEYHGEITYIDYYNYVQSNGTTAYPVEVTIENVEDEEKRTISPDGTVNKVYKTGMTSTVNTYSLVSIQNTDGGTMYNYENDISILCVNNDTTTEYYIGSNMLNQYLDGSYTDKNSFYTFSDDFTKLTVEVQNETKMLKCGMNVDAEIIIEKKENVVAVPLSAVARGNNVKVLKNNNTNNDGKVPANAEYEEIRVTTGISDNNYIEILSGLSVGDVIIIPTISSGNDLFNMFGNMSGSQMNMGGGRPTMGNSTTQMPQRNSNMGGMPR